MKIYRLRFVNFEEPMRSRSILGIAENSGSALDKAAVLRLNEGLCSYDLDEFNCLGSVEFGLPAQNTEELT